MGGGGWRRLLSLSFSLHFPWFISFLSGWDFLFPFLPTSSIRPSLPDHFCTHWLHPFFFFVCCCTAGRYWETLRVAVSREKKKKKEKKARNSVETSKKSRVRRRVQGSRWARCFWLLSIDLPASTVVSFFYFFFFCLLQSQLQLPSFLSTRFPHPLICRYSSLWTVARLDGSPTAMYFPFISLLISIFIFSGRSRTDGGHHRPSNKIQKQNGRNKRVCGRKKGNCERTLLSRGQRRRVRVPTGRRILYYHEAEMDLFRPFWSRPFPMTRAIIFSEYYTAARSFLRNWLTDTIIVLRHECDDVGINDARYWTSL